MDKKVAKALIDKYLSGQCTPAEEAQVETWYNQLAGQQKDKPELPDYEARNAQIKAGLPPEPAAQPKVVRLWPHIAAAASILICLGVGIYYYNQTGQPKPVVQMAHNVIAPGGNKAVLTLANGHRIILADVRDGQLAAQGNTVIIKKADGEVIYNYRTSRASASAELTYNTISTPRGGQYQVILPDGSHAWLNAASSIRFPTAFTGEDREVAITGEAYFEVAHDKAKPFRVNSAGQTVEVLGTHFNINAYDDEPTMNTTLLEGSVKITHGTELVLLKPGQQASTAYGTNNIRTKNTDAANAVAWKNGLFSFKQADIKTIMRQISRWYDLDIEYRGMVPDKKLSGEIYRSASGDEALQILKYAHIPFRVDGKKIIISTN